MSLDDVKATEAFDGCDGQEVHRLPYSHKF